MQQNRFQFEFYGLFMDFIRKKRELFWKPVLKRIKHGNLTEFEENIQAKFPKAWIALNKLSHVGFSRKVNNAANMEFFRDFARQVKKHSKVRRFVVWLMSYEGPKGLYDNYGPFVKVGKFFRLKKPYQHFYFHNFRKFNQIMFDQGIAITWVLIPGRYGELPFKKSVEKVGSPWVEKARIFLLPFFSMVRESLVSVWHSKNLHIQGSNEKKHQGTADGVQLKMQHEFFHETFAPFVPDKRWDSDVSGSDYIQLTEREWYCIIKDQAGKEMDRLLSKADYESAKEGQLVIGDKTYTWIRTIRIVGKDSYDRHNWLKQNAMNPWEIDRPHHPPDSPTWAETWKGSASNKYIVSTDGNMEGSGEKFCGEDDTFVNLTYDELGQLIDRCEKLEDDDGLLVIVSDLPKEVFAKNADDWAEERWDLVNLERLEVIPTRMGPD